MPDELGANYEMDLDNKPREFWDELGISRSELEDILELQKQLEARAPAIGTQAPDFRLERLDIRGKASGNYESLANHRGTPVALLFGSYT